MDALKLTIEEIRKMDAGQLRNTEGDIRKQLAQIRMDVYTAPMGSRGKISKLKRTLAQVLTISNEQVKGKKQ